MNKNIGSYIGPRGYTLLKNEISIECLKKIRADLTVKPIMNPCAGPMAEQVKYPIYRESTSKIYMPIYYGIAEFGSPGSVLLPEGDDIDAGVVFVGKLRENQPDVVRRYLEACRGNSWRCGGGLLDLPPAFGKTTLTLYIVAQLRKKTAVIVHQTFLGDQWKERIQQYLPNARVGRIQGKTVDIEDKDIVIIMLQSLSMKDYDLSLFKSFGLLVVDEVHHIGSQVFSNALFTIVPRYTLGLSGTMDRKDGTTHVIEKFLGPVIFKGARIVDYNMETRAIFYKTDDKDFNKVIYDFRGDVAYSSMISKLCSYIPRSEFILRILKDLLKERPGKQIIILAHNKNLLTYLHDKIEERKIASVGYYIGGMKEEGRKESEGKNVIIATYSMAAEGLDIKTLSILIMATPKSDIAQCVGRIKREIYDKHIVVDIIDPHPTFRNQWAKRRAFYKKEKYNIVYPVSKEAEAEEEEDEVEEEAEVEAPTIDISRFAKK